MSKDEAIDSVAAQIIGTWNNVDYNVHLGFGYFANVLDIGNGRGIAITTDGVGSKATIAQEMNKYDTIGIDCVAMNVNDLLCVGATPISMVDYIAMETAIPHILKDLVTGLCTGVRRAGISLSGGELSRGHTNLRGGYPWTGFDLCGTAVGDIDLSKVIIGQHISDGDALIGIQSSGIHSNGLTIAKQALRSLHDAVMPPQNDWVIGEELLCPTHIYVPEVLELLKSDIDVKSLIHITGTGLLNLTRTASDFGYIIDNLLPTYTIFNMIQREGNLSDELMFSTFNMGIGFCVVVPDASVDKATEIVRSGGMWAEKIGYAVHDTQRRIYILPKHLVSSGNTFTKF